jgi:hypothetical protein
MDAAGTRYFEPDGVAFCALACLPHADPAHRQGGSWFASARRREAAPEKVGVVIGSKSCAADRDDATDPTAASRGKPTVNSR